MSHQQPYDPSPFHAGERQVQERLGVRDIEGWGRKVVRPYLPEQHRAFHTALPFLVIAARDGKGRPWASLLVGPEGFVASPDPRSLVIAAKPVAGDALEGALVEGADLGILGIELATRRRNRVNGRITAAHANAIRFAVEQAFGNCPQYIREREWRPVDGAPAGPAKRGTRLTSSQRDWIAAADTFFIASGHSGYSGDNGGEGDSPVYGMDASHRGGDPGFVEVAGATRLLFPDYAGNNHFNTIGNLVLDPRAGLLFVDFESGSLLQLTGRAAIDWDSDAVARYPGARRLVAFEIDGIVELPAAVPLRWDANAESVRSLRLVEKTRESADVTSFVFEARDGGPLPAHRAGQHLPIELHVPGVEQPVRRTYSLSGAPSDRRYRISVKREPHGLASRHLHDSVEVGTILDARTPAGDFLLPCRRCPVVLVSAGVGVTPLASILHDLAATESGYPIWFVHGARDGDHHPLAEEVRAIAVENPDVRVHVAYSRPRPEDELGTHYDSAGRIDGELLERLVRDLDAHFMLCGPTGFMAEIQESLEARSVPGDRIHTESFGPKA
jgi:ferredoxin-NADP reductase/predicted pyridoxine 5'-phosphate oxidase superfamily flavin-nucleotide-binding protein